MTDVMMALPITLSIPIDIDGVKTNKLTMRRPKVKDRLMIDRMPNSNSMADSEKEVLMFANLCDVPAEALEELDMGDYKKLGDTFSSFSVSPKPGS